MPQKSRTKRANVATAAKRDIPTDYMKSTLSWNDRLTKYAELCTLEFYLTKYEVRNNWSAAKNSDAVF